MAWFSSTKYPQFEEKVKEATSESIPNGDIDFATALEVSDMIRSKQIPPKESMRALKKRFMEAENVNLQKSAFKLIDFCIKNGGEHFISEIASKEFMDPLVIKLKDKTINEGLKAYLLENIQTWSIMVSADAKFDYINKTYRKLQDDGFEFPTISDVIDSTMIDSKVAPEWQDSDACMLCSKMFTFINRKHHCRSCGGVFCAQHSSKSIELPEFGINIPVRVCDNCYTDQKAKKKKLKKSKKHSDSKSSDSKILVDEEVDDEIKRAIELSLKDSAAKGSYNPTSNVNAAITQDEDEDEDEAMKAAIAASLQELNQSNTNGDAKLESIKEPEIQKDTSTGLYSNLLSDKPFLPSSHSSIVQPTELPQPQQHLYTKPQPQRLPQHTQHPQQFQQQLQTQQHEAVFPTPTTTSYDTVRGADEKRVVDFIQLLEALKQQSSRTGIVDPKLIQLHSDMVLLHPKIGAAISNEHAEIEKYQSSYSKLFAISRLYDDILQGRLKQEQDLLKSQHTFNAASMSPSYGSVQYEQQIPLHLNQPQQYLSPQSTFGHAPPVHQLQAYQHQTGSFSSHFMQTPIPNAAVSSYNLTPQATHSNPQSYPSVPTSFSIPDSTPQFPQYQQPPQIEPSSPYSHQISSTDSANARHSAIAEKLPSLGSLQYASLPAIVSDSTLTAENTEPDATESQAHPVAPVPQKEPEIVNLIDL